MDPSYDVIIQDVCTLLKSCHQFFYDVWGPFYGFLKRKPPYIEVHAQPLWDPRVVSISWIFLAFSAYGRQIYLGKASSKQN